MRFLAIAVLALCSAWYVRDTYIAQIRGLDTAPSDFFHYYRAGAAVLHGQSPFGGPDFNYPPLIAFVCAPLAALPYPQARVLFFALSHACLLVAAWLLSISLGRGWL